jgi:hypothetical protein
MCCGPPLQQWLRFPVVLQPSSATVAEVSCGDAAFLCKQWLSSVTIQYSKLFGLLIFTACVPLVWNVSRVVVGMF